MTERVAREGLMNVEVRLVEPDDPGLAEGSVDRILIVDTWHLIENRARYAARLGRCLRAGGRVLVVDYTLESLLGPPREERLPASDVEREFRGAGFEVELLEESLPWQYAVVATRPR